MDEHNMNNHNHISFIHEYVIHLVELNDYQKAIAEIKKQIRLSNNYDELAFAHLSCGFLNTKLKNYIFAVKDFSNAIYFENKLDFLSQRSKDISLNARSNARYKCENFEGAIDDKREAKRMRLFEEKKYSKYKGNFLDYKTLLLKSFDQLELDQQSIFLIKISELEKPKYDLIEDYKKFINDKKKLELINNLELISESKYQIGDYKGSIKAIRRSEKYYF